MQKIRLFLLNLIAGNQTVLLNAHIKNGTVMIKHDGKVIISNCNFEHELETTSIE